MYYHYTSAELFLESLEDRSCEQDDGAFKPYGLWLSYNDEWKIWCEKERFRDFKTVNLYKIELEYDKLIVISNYTELIDFENKYKVFRTITWEQVSEDYDGIIIKNYNEIINELRSLNKVDDSLWFFTIDVNGGCIWNPRSIISFEKIN